MKNKKIILGLLFSSILPLTGCNDTSISSHLKLSIVGNNNVGINEYITLKKMKMLVGHLQINKSLQFLQQELLKI